MVLPDFQGIGIGSRMLDIISEFYHEKQNIIQIRTINMGLILKLKSSKNWILKYINTPHPDKFGVCKQSRRAITFKFAPK